MSAAQLIREYLINRAYLADTERRQKEIVAQLEPLRREINAYMPQRFIDAEAGEVIELSKDWMDELRIEIVKDFPLLESIDLPADPATDAPTDSELEVA